LAEAPVTGECTQWASGNNYGTMPNWDTSLVTDMSGRIWGPWTFQGFGNKDTFNGDITKWNTMSLENMYSMFNTNSAFNQDISGWKTSKVTTMREVFRGATVFNQNISGWNTLAVEDMAGMFYGASAFNADISGWNTLAVTTMGDIFNQATAMLNRGCPVNGPPSSCTS